MSFASESRPLRKTIAQALPVEFHCHGIGNYDFSDIDNLNLELVNELAREEHVYCVPSIFLAFSKLDAFCVLMQKYAKARSNGQLSHILGISLEGPLLASFGGTPEQGSWAPTKKEWEKLARCGNLGLLYTVLSPDALLKGSYLMERMTPEHPSLLWIVNTLLEAGIRPALGHFHKASPEASAKAAQEVIDVAKNFGPKPSHRIITDHLFNDMPLQFRHAWRTPEARLNRKAEMAQQRPEKWTMDNLAKNLGEVPAVLMRAAHEGFLTICLNFDNEHVDLEICKHVVRLLGSKVIIGMTDRIDVNQLGGQSLQKKEHSTLWYQKKGVVAAGTSSIRGQIGNLESIGLNQEEINDIISYVPLNTLGLTVK